MASPASETKLGTIGTGVLFISHLFLMLDTTVGSTFTPRTPILSRGAAHKAGSLGHRDGSTGVETKTPLVGRKNVWPRVICADDGLCQRVATDAQEPSFLSLKGKCTSTTYSCGDVRQPTVTLHYRFRDGRSQISDN